jgi:hypothetical protein
VKWNVNIDEVFTEGVCNNTGNFGCFQIDAKSRIKFFGWVQGIFDTPLGLWHPLVIALTNLGVFCNDCDCRSFGDLECGCRYTTIRNMNETLYRSSQRHPQNSIVAKIKSQVEQKLEYKDNFTLQLADVYGEEKKECLYSIIGLVRDLKPLIKRDIDRLLYLQQDDIVYCQGGTSELVNLRLQINGYLNDIKSRIIHFLEKANTINETPIRQHFRDKVWQELMEVVWPKKNEVLVARD